MADFCGGENIITSTKLFVYKRSRKRIYGVDLSALKRNLRNQFSKQLRPPGLSGSPNSWRNKSRYRLAVEEKTLDNNYDKFAATITMWTR